MSSMNSQPIRGALPEYISIISANRCARIRINDIEVIEQEGRRLHVMTAERDYSFYGSMNTLATSLAERAFYRVLKGVIINFDHVREISKSSIAFNSGQSMTLGRNSINKTRKAYKRYLMRYPPYSLWDPMQLEIMSVHEAEKYSSQSTDEKT